MEISFFLAKIIGWYLIIIGLYVILRKDLVKSLIGNLINESTDFFIINIFSVILGLILVSVHNYWLMGWPVIITIIAWLILVDNITRLFFPEQVLLRAQWWLDNYNYMVLAALVYLLIGLFLLGKAYGFF